MKLFEKITKSPVYYSVLYSFGVMVISIVSAVFAMNAAAVNEVDFRFIGPVAIFFMILSVLFTLLPFNLLRTLAWSQFRRVNKSFTKSLPKFFLVSELPLTVFVVLSYMGAMGGSVWGGVGLLMLTALNIIGVVLSGAAFIVGYSMNRYSDNVIKYKVEALSAQSTVSDFLDKASNITRNT